jgi:hypothetical protein
MREPNMESEPSPCPGCDMPLDESAVECGACGWVDEDALRQIRVESVLGGACGH